MSDPDGESPRVVVQDPDAPRVVVHDPDAADENAALERGKKSQPFVLKNQARRGARDRPYPLESR